MDRTAPREGDLYETYRVEGHVFPVRYGYYTELDRRSERWEGENLAPILPDFYAAPVYNARGFPLAANTQTPCAHYKPRDPQGPEDWCRDCACYPQSQPVIGLCSCPARRRSRKGSTKMEEMK